MSALSIFFGSVFGNAQNVAEQLNEHLTEKGIETNLVEDPEVEDLKDAKAIIFVSSTCGLGDVPPNLEGLLDEARDESLDLEGTPFVVAGLGDSSYVDSFCGGGRKVFAFMEEVKGKAVAPFFEVDSIETFEPETDVIEFVDGILDKLV